MKKVIGIALVMLLVCAVMASADGLNWRISLKATNASNLLGSTTYMGWYDTYTNGVDAQGEPSTPPAPPLSSSTAYAVAMLDTDGGAGSVWAASLKDYRAPLTQGQVLPELQWDFLVYWGQNGGTKIINPVKVVITQMADAYDYSYGPLTITVRNTVEYGAERVFVYDAMTPFTAMTVNFVRPTAWAYNEQVPDITVHCGGEIPEPGSMLALGSGLVGLLGYAIRRRR